MLILLIITAVANFEATALMPPPKPPVCFTDEDVKLKFVGEECKLDSDCYNNFQNSTACFQGRCACTEGFLPESHTHSSGKTHEICVHAPFAGQLCDSICKKPAVCSEISTQPQGLHPSPGSGPPRPPQKKHCICEQPYVLKGFSCYKECKSDEFYELQSGDCKKRCTKDDVLVDNGVCKKRAKLGESCEDERQCSTPFADCQTGVCTCGAGFKAAGGACQPTVQSCPVGDPISKDGNVVLCTVQKRHAGALVAVKDALQTPGAPPPSGEIAMRVEPPLRLTDSTFADSCGDGQFCLVTSHQAYTEQGASGHCCQKPKITCPVGLAHPNATCGMQASILRQESDASAPYCPQATHSCYRVSFGASYAVSLCCPKACAGNQILVNGVCYPRRQWGDPCELNDQCKAHEGVCSSNGTCQCPANFKLQGDTVKSCELQCKPGEVKINQQCVGSLKVGDVCDPNLPLCPHGGSYCNIKSKRCTCACGFVKLDEKNCGPEPKCGHEPLNATGVTFCNVPKKPKSPISAAVDSCPAGQYCGFYTMDTGICCPKPEKPFCIDGTPGNGTCDPFKSSAQCGRDSICSRFLFPASDPSTRPDPSEHTCCPIKPIIATPRGDQKK